MNPERPNYSTSSGGGRKPAPVKRFNDTDADGNMPEKKRSKPSQGLETVPNIASDFDSNFAPSHGKQERIILEKYMPVFFLEYKLDNKKCVICMNELEKLCPSCEEKELQAAKASFQNAYANIVESCQITWGECTHVFHDHCLQNWFDQSMFKNECPLDRQPFKIAKKKY